jgi:hypothetical protein
LASWRRGVLDRIFDGVSVISGAFFAGWDADGEVVVGGG